MQNEFKVVYIPITHRIEAYMLSPTDLVRWNRIIEIETTENPVRLLAWIKADNLREALDIFWRLYDEYEAEDKKYGN